MNASPLAIFDVGVPEALLIFFAVLLLFGGQKLPELARGLGKSIREFKKASAGVEQEIRRAIEAEPEPVREHRTVGPAGPAHPLPVAKPAIPPPENLQPPFDTRSSDERAS
jgi:sec-independent protein translocase protein TatA